MGISARQENRQHSKGTILKAAEILWRENQALRKFLVQKRRRVLLERAGFLVGGTALGAVLTELLRSFR
jgi:hypothetical protein